SAWGRLLGAPGRRRLRRGDRGGDADEDLRPRDRRGVHPRDAAEDAVGRMGPVLGRAGEGGGGGLTVRAGGNGRVGAALRRGDMSAPEMAAVWDVTVCG